jgi:AraC family transcriptional regulator, regulatory protein of adaptative response / methylated-DNA-[protein]-cysteine methyltransferase
MNIRFGFGQCSLGTTLVAATENGVCAILLGDHPEVLQRELHDRFPQASLVAGDAEFDPVVARVAAFIDAPAQGLDLKLDMHGTPLQAQVWRALREIPVGHTASYSEIAERIGAPKEAKAIAEACAANAIAVAIPCHRVVRKNGGLGGYRWGFKRKRALLNLEAAAA